MVAAVVLVAQVLDRGGGQSFGFVDDDEFGVVGYLALCWASGFDVLVDADVDAGVQQFEVVAEFTQGAGDGGGVEQGARSGERGVDVLVGVLAWAPGAQQVLGFVPAGVAVRGLGFAYSGWPVADSDVAVAFDGVGEFDEASVFFGGDEGPAPRGRHGQSSW